MPQRKMSPEWAVSKAVPNEDGCWEWTGAPDKDGYGRVQVDGSTLRAHRYLFEAFVRPLREGEQIDHLCRNRKCVNPAHLEAVTLRENVDRSSNYIALNRKKTHCPQGHPYSGANLYVCPRGWRQCIACRDGFSIDRR